jgi:hypothetical protein
MHEVAVKHVVAFRTHAPPTAPPAQGCRRTPVAHVDGLAATVNGSSVAAPTPATRHIDVSKQVVDVTCAETWNLGAANASVLCVLEVSQGTRPPRIVSPSWGE